MNWFTSCKHSVNTQGEVTSQNLWPRYNCHFVGITWQNVWSWWAKIYRVISIKFNPLVYENVHMTMTNWPLTCQRSVFKQYHISKHFWEFYLQDGSENQLALIWVEITSLSLYVYGHFLYVVFMCLCICLVSVFLLASSAKMGLVETRLAIIPGAGQ